MRIHSDKIDMTHIVSAARTAGVTPHVTSHGSRKMDHAFEVNLEGSGRWRGQWGNGDYHAATWDEWGIFLNALYEVDPHMIAGPYKGASEDSYEGFHFLTGGRYRTLTPQDQHKAHRWTHDSGVVETHTFVPGTPAAYYENKCKCGAVRRWVPERFRAVAS